MKRNYFTWIVGILLVMNTALQAQIGLTYRHALGFENIPEMDNFIFEHSLRTHTNVVALDYQFKLVNYGLYFGPEVYVGFTNLNNLMVEDPQQPIPSSFSGKSMRWGIAVPVKINVFNFDQCDECPTFRKKGQFLKKSFFIQPVIGYEQRDYTASESSQAPLYEGNNKYVTGGLGVGVDVRMNKYFKITPIVTYRQYWALDEHVLYKNKINVSSLELGVRLGWGK